MATMVAVFTACNNEFMNMGQEENLTPNATLKNNSSGEAEEEPLNYIFLIIHPAVSFSSTWAKCIMRAWIIY